LGVLARAFGGVELGFDGVGFGLRKKNRMMLAVAILEASNTTLAFLFFIHHSD
jgi:hypothetical protein